MSDTKLETVKDEQTGQVFVVVPEGKADIIAAWISALYSILIIGLFAWLLLDTWSGQGTVLKWLLSDQLANNLKDVPIFKLIVYTAIGGGMGAAVNNLRSFIQWHAERQSFGWRFIWKYVAMPPLGATLAALVYGILQGGMAVFNGGETVGGSSITSLSAWATGMLAGYGSHKVFIWLDEKVNSLFKVEPQKVTVPDVSGKSPEEARQVLVNTRLEVGEPTTSTTTDPQKIGKVIGQAPPAGTEITCNSKVTIVVGAPAGTMGAETPPDLAAKTVEEAQQIKTNGKPVQPAENGEQHDVVGAAVGDLVDTAKDHSTDG